MPAEYTYFRAKGAALTAIETVKESAAEVAALEKRLARHFGADSLYGAFDPATGRYRVDHFTFLPPKTIPEGWLSQNEYNNAALPPPGSSAHFHMAAVSGLMDRAARRMSLERLLGTDDMPPRDMPPGRYSTRFVRYESLEDDNEPVKKPGSLMEKDVAAISGAIGPAHVLRADPLAVLKMGDDWFIRVPNRPGTEIPHFTPPDSVPVPYEKMLEEDTAEQTRNYYRLRAESMGWGC